MCFLEGSDFRGWLNLFWFLERLGFRARTNFGIFLGLEVTLICAVLEVLTWLGFGPELICVVLEEFSSRAPSNIHPKPINSRPFISWTNVNTWCWNNISSNTSAPGILQNYAKNNRPTKCRGHTSEKASNRAWTYHLRQFRSLLQKVLHQDSNPPPLQFKQKYPCQIYANRARPTRRAPIYSPVSMDSIQINLALDFVNHSNRSAEIIRGTTPNLQSSVNGFNSNKLGTTFCEPPVPNYSRYHP